MDDSQAKEALLGMLKLKTQKAEIDTSELKYVIYARKSTLGEDRQEKSIEDQVRICRETAVSRGLRVVDIIEEKGSAKESGTRPKFANMLNNLTFGKIDGIIAWHADRLSRNMKDAGEIIDMLDRKTLKDLQFATSVFENNPTGKMLLGISFVLSKQYSEHLSESVTRGNNSRTEQGIFLGKFKHGYYMDKNNHLFPDGDNFILIKEAFEMRLEGVSLEMIAKHLNKEGYTKCEKNGTHTKHKWTKQNLSNVFRDPFYCGVLLYGDSYAPLSDHYDFSPAVSTADFLKINNVSTFNKSSKLVLADRSITSKKPRANLWRGMVTCSECNNNMESGITTKRDSKTKETIKERYYYRCPIKGCINGGKSMRPKYILEFMHEFFDENIEALKNKLLYEEYTRQFEDIIINRKKDLASDLKSVITRITNKEKRENDIKDFLIKPDSASVAKYYSEDLKLIGKDIENLTDEKNRIINEQKALKDSRKTYDEYLELLQKIPDLLRSELDMETLDAIGRVFFSNFSICKDSTSEQQGYKVKYKLKEPWNRLFEYANVACGTRERT